MVALFRENLVENLKAFLLMFLISFLYVFSTVIHSLYLFGQISSGNLAFFIIALIYLFIFIGEFLFLIKISDNVFFQEDNLIFDIDNILYYVKNKLLFLTGNVIILFFFNAILNNFSNLFLSSFELQKLSYLVYLPKFLLFYVIIYNIKNNLSDDLYFTGFLKEIKNNYFMSVLGIILLFVGFYAFDFFLVVSNSAISIRLLMSIPIAILLYLYHIFIFSIE